MLRAIAITATIGAALSLGACANDTLLGGSGATASTAALPAKPPADPACTALAGRIDALRRDGVVDRVEAAAKGKGETVSVKRASLGQIAELEKANADFQAKCSTVPRAPVSAAAAQPAAGKAVPAVKTAATAAAAPGIANPTAVVKPAVKAAVKPAADAANAAAAVAPKQ